MGLKRYLVFAFDEYYPDGGWNDFRGDFDTLDEAQAEERYQLSHGADLTHVVDSQKGYKVE
jgi:hypothetical protein